MPIQPICCPQSAQARAQENSSRNREFGFPLSSPGTLLTEIWVAIRTDAPIAGTFSSGTRDDPFEGSTVGLDLNQYTDAVVENNLLDVSDLDYGVRHANAGTLKVFNNMRSDGTLVRGYNTVTHLHDPELTTDVEDVYLAL